MLILLDVEVFGVLETCFDLFRLVRIYHVQPRGKAGTGCPLYH